ncbi:MAG: squalene--hopene cyclase [Planctomycetia bacterium]|nr:squalene--hopene cyclase [Planctomycetia bacterium]
MIDQDRLRRAYLAAREALLAERTPAGHWVGELSSSALSTATAVSALAIARRHVEPEKQRRYTALIDAALPWLARCQNADGGWGDTDRSFSNIATTMLVRAALHLAGAQQRYAAALERAENYISVSGGIAGLRRRYGKDKTFAVPILTNCALAGLVEWREVSPLPFELACLPQAWYRFARLPVVSYAIPALVAIGQARYFFRKPWNPVIRWLRGCAVNKSLEVLRAMQPSGGGYLEAAPLTSFVVMSLASIGRHDHIVAQEGLRFLCETVRPDGSWPIDTNLATWVTTLAINALEYSLESDGTTGGTYLTPELIQWVADCQHRERHPFTGAEPGGWGWSDLSGALPDADDTPGAVLALSDIPIDEIEDYDNQWSIAWEGLDWLLKLQNSDGGWPTFCKGWGMLPFDRSGTDLTAHVLRALKAWGRDKGIAVERGFRYLAKQQRPDGSWLPLWFGNQHREDDENPLYGTARVLLAYRDLERMPTPEARRGIAYLLSQQNSDGGWGGEGNNRKPAERSRNEEAGRSSVEETAVVVEALLAECSLKNGISFDAPEKLREALEKGLNWLIEGVESGRFRQASPIGFYFAKLWYYEKLYPLVFTVSALRHAVARMALPPP